AMAAELVVGFGGGSSMDVAKLVALRAVQSAPDAVTRPKRRSAAASVPQAVTSSAGRSVAAPVA
ncbi:iron-containing alcohol dehydrogenase, partial [Pseudomonas aeruginosa]|uniref:iron-containing alcohol dehydrogenase n=1 Tax=Pseudomonas aeruginosa TaxID=287 RepID=UPI001F08DAD2